MPDEKPGKPDVMAGLRAHRKKERAARPLPQPYRLDEEDSLPPKLLLYGHTGTGKTFFIVGLLLAGERVFVLSCDFGSNGLVTVKNELKRLGKPELLKNLVGIDFSIYEDVWEFFDDPLDYVPNLLEFDPTVSVFEGFSAFNIDLVDEHILSKTPGAKEAGALRYAGLTHTQQDWQGMKRGTVRIFRRFLAFTLPNGKRLAKIITCLQSKPEVNQLTQATERTALIHGTGRDLMGPGFDAILQCFKDSKTDKDDDTVKYLYRCEGSSKKFLVKSRGFQLSPIEPAEPERIWRIIRGETKPNESTNSNSPAAA